MMKVSGAIKTIWLYHFDISKSRLFLHK